MQGRQFRNIVKFDKKIKDRYKIKKRLTGFQARINKPLKNIKIITIIIWENIKSQVQKLLSWHYNHLTLIVYTVFTRNSHNYYCIANIII